MNEKEYNEYKELNDKFYDRCNYLTNELLTRLDDDFEWTEDFYLMPGVGHEVCCKGSYCRWQEWTDVTLYFPASLLYATDDEVNSYIDAKLKEEKKKEKEREEMLKQQEIEYELSELARLKKKYEK